PWRTRPRGHRTLRSGRRVQLKAYLASLDSHPSDGGTRESIAEHGREERHHLGFATSQDHWALGERRPNRAQRARKADQENRSCAELEAHWGRSSRSRMSRNETRRLHVVRRPSPRPPRRNHARPELHRAGGRRNVSRMITETRARDAH